VHRGLEAQYKQWKINSDSYVCVCIRHRAGSSWCFLVGVFFCIFSLSIFSGRKSKDNICTFLRTLKIIIQNFSHVDAFWTRLRTVNEHVVGQKMIDVPILGVNPCFVRQYGKGIDLVDVLILGVNSIPKKVHAHSSLFVALAKCGAICLNRIDSDY
jgi:hypothetical protein